jgi:GTPase-associated protein 1, N-terminal domain type 1
MKSSKIDIIAIDQVLHGYQNGHSLIASSIDLLPESKRSLLVMSDMSGQSMKNGFEEYVTGYPLKDMNFYALAKTWYAPEMKRPGCVWTHTLLIKFSDLVQLDDQHNLCALFKRPGTDLSFDQYSSKTEIIVNDRNSVFLNDCYEKSFLEDLIFQLYSQHGFSLLIQNQNSLELESLILSIWLQQWPRLKRNFSFCTGSISPRLINGKYLDLQVIPENETTIKSSNDFIFLNATFAKPRKEQWVKVIHHDLIAPSILRGFLKNFGVDVKNERTSFMSLVKLFIYLKDNKDEIKIFDLIRVLGELFPLNSDANILKTTLLAQNVSNYLKVPSFKEEELLFQLSITPYYKSFDPEKLLLKKRVFALYSNKPEHVLSMLNDLVSLDINPFGIEMLKEIAPVINGNNLETINLNYRKLLLIFLKLYPKLSYYDSFWKCSAEDQKENFYILSKINEKENIDWQRIVNKVLDLEACIDKEIIRDNSLNIITYVLNWLNNDSNHQLNHDMKTAINSHPNEILLWVNNQKKINLNTVELLLFSLNPNSSEVINNGYKLWLSLLKKNEIQSDDRLTLKLKAFLLALMFNKPDKNSFEILSITFESVYISLLNESLDFDSWKYIEYHTIPLSWWNDWDKAKKLLIALRKLFSMNEWQSNDIEKIFKNKDVSDKVLNQFKRL